MRRAEHIPHSILSLVFHLKSCCRMHWLKLLIWTWIALGSVRRILTFESSVIYLSGYKFFFITQGVRVMLRAPRTITRECFICRLQFASKCRISSVFHPYSLKVVIQKAICCQPDSGLQDAFSQNGSKTGRQIWKIDVYSVSFLVHFT